MMKKITYLFMILLLMQSCIDKQNENENLINQINQINQIDKEYELEVDSLNNIIDTISIREFKKNKNKLVYEKYIIPADEWTIFLEKYYRNGELFYSENSSSVTGLLSKYIAWQVNDTITKSTLINYDENKTDTIKIKYNYTYKDTLLTQLDIISKKNNIVKSKNSIVYNKNEKRVVENIIEGTDTVSYVKYFYKDQKLSRKVKTDYVNGFVNISSYDVRGFIISKDEFIIDEEDSLKKINEKSYITNENGDITKENHYNLIDKTEKNIIYKKNE